MSKIKVKTRSSAKKRFRVTGTGKLRSQGAGFAHLREDKKMGNLKKKMRVKDVDKTMVRLTRALLPTGVKGRQIKVEKKEVGNAR